MIRFERNSAVFGGTIFAQLGTKVVVINSTFLKNYARDKGGVLVVEGGGNVSIISSNFHKNSAHIDGGMLTLSESNLYIDRSMFTFNHAYSRGVIFANDDNTNVYMIKNSYVSNNSASLLEVLFMQILEQEVLLYSYIIISQVIQQNSRQQCCSLIII